MRSLLHFSGISFIVLIFLFPIDNYAQWNNNPLINNEVCSSTGPQHVHVTVSDDKGGTIVIWDDGRAAAPVSKDIYAQRITANGQMLWTVNGKNICNVDRDQKEPYAIKDGSGGAFIAWIDNRNNGTSADDIYIQRIDSNGNALWGLAALPVCTATNIQYEICMVADGFGGVIVCWTDLRVGGEKVYAQRVDGNGNMLWATNGIYIQGGMIPKIVSDSKGGAIITSMRYVGGIQSYNIQANRINHAGVTLWGAAGMPICAVNYDQWAPTIAADKKSGATIIWSDKRNNSFWQLYVQKVDSNGGILFPINGTAINTNASANVNAVTTDFNGGCFVTWHDYRPNATSSSDIYVQHLDSNAIPLWTMNGVLVCDEIGNQFDPALDADTAGNVNICWIDTRTQGNNGDIYAQRVTNAGVPVWPQNDVAVSTLSSTQEFPHVTSSNVGEAIFVWRDWRNAGQLADIYTTKVFVNGILPIQFLDFTAEKSNDNIELLWTTVMEQNNKLFNIERSVNGIDFMTIGSVYSKAVNGNSNEKLNYFYIDKKPFAGKSYYRIQQIDLDDKTMYSKVIEAHFGIKDMNVLFYPNPVTELVYIDFVSTMDAYTCIKITDVNGREIKKQFIQTRKGANHLDFNIMDISEGVYFINLIQNNRLLHKEKFSISK